MKVVSYEINCIILLQKRKFEQVTHKEALITMCDKI